ncbi:MAG TPA: GntR family transcriptional regulator [Pyrinomonadaceae bacterium]|nr:GntR family transcriptional regulator [Pyrinomonadaceae bacterium]
MTKFFIDKTNKIPIYLQLKDQIKYFISTGSLKAEEKLPPVKILAKNLGINFLTVRKAYKELEESGLINVRHGEGTFISLGNERRKTNNSETERQNFFADEMKQLLRKFMQTGLELAELKQITERIYEEIEYNNSIPIIVFAECNQFQIKQISGILEAELRLRVEPMLIADLPREIPSLIDKGRKINIITTGFHTNEVREAVGDLQIQIDVLITNLNPETRRQLEAFGEKASYSFICRDKESAVLYKDLLKAELGFRQINLTACILTETKKVQEILESSDVVLTSPPVYEEVVKLAKNAKSVFNVFERVDPMSLKVIKDRILESRKF